MKKTILLILTAVLSLTMQAKVGFVVLGDNTNRATMSGGAEQAAYDWFKTTYVDQGTGAFISLDAIPTTTATYSTIWVMVDRSIDVSGFNGLFGDTQKANLTAFVKAGGNLLLTKQATRLVYTMDESNRRIGYAPEFAETGDFNTGERRAISTNMGAGCSDKSDKSTHAIYGVESGDLMKRWPAENNVGGDKRIFFAASGTDNGLYRYCGWKEIFNGSQAKNDNCSNRTPFETDWNATILGIRGDIRDYCFSDVILFNSGYDNNTWKGNILAIGSASYIWTSGDHIEMQNLKKLTSNSLSFLEARPEIDLSGIESDVKDGTPVELPAQIGDKTVAYSIGDATCVTLNNRTLTYASDGEFTLTVTYTETSGTAQWPKGTYTYPKQMTASPIQPDPSADMAYLKPASLSTAEQNAANWFKETYIGLGKPGKFIDNLSDLTGIKVLWINIENTTTGKGDFSDADATALADFVQDGGHVLLTKKATYWAYRTGRITCEPNFYSSGIDEQTTVATKLGYNVEHYDKSTSKLYDGFIKGTNEIITLADNVYGYKTYCGWQDFKDKNCSKVHDPINVKICATGFESAWNAEALGIEGNIGDYCYSNIIHFLGDEDTWHGSMLAIGASAYNWNSNNANVKALTENALNLLRNTEPVVKKVENPSAETAFLLMANTVNDLPEGPERNAAKEFAKTYFAETEQASEGRYISLSDLSDIPDKVKTIIIHADRETRVDWNDVNGVNVTSALTTWVKAGGNLVLLCQATKLASDMGRINYAPWNETIATGTNGESGSDFRKINVKLGTRTDPALTANTKGQTAIDRSGDPLFDKLDKEEVDGKILITLFPEGTTFTNRCYWQEILFDGTDADPDDKSNRATESRANFDTFEANYNCEVLAVESNVQDFCLASIIRFKSGKVPADSNNNWEGSILAIGAGGFQYKDENSANFDLMNTLVQNGVESIKSDPCTNCFRITIR